MTEKIPQSIASPWWLHAWALLTVLCTFPLLTLGAEVTTKNVAMADPDGKTHVREPWVLIRQWQDGTLAERGLGYTIEHSHRFVGIIVGLCTVVLALGLWLGEKRMWLRLLGTAALVMVVGQGLLGIFRVDLNALMGRNLALLHGCLAQLVFAVLLSISVFTSRFWSMPIAGRDVREQSLLRRLNLFFVFAVYGQLVLGALVRHNGWILAARVHQLMAFIVVVMAAWLIRETVFRAGVSRREVIGCCFLGILLLMQVGLGIESWLNRFPGEDILGSRQVVPFAGLRDFVRSLHYVTGSLVFANAMVLMLWACRPVARAGNAFVSPRLHERELEGVV